MAKAKGIVFATLTLLLLTCLASGQDDRIKIISRAVDREQYANTWNDIEDAVTRLNETRHELGENIKLYAPWYVNSEPKQIRRRELYDAAARDAELMAKRYRQLRDLEQ